MLNITFNQIRLFEAVARLRSYTKAAKELNISQPAVSSQLKKLSESLGDPLVEVVGRKIYLTPVGETSFKQFQQLLDNIDHLGTQIRIAQSSGLEGTLKIIGTAASKYFLPFMLAEFLKQNPKVIPDLQVLNSLNELSQQPLEDCDLLVTGKVLPEHQNQLEHFTDQEIIVVSSPNCRLGDHSQISIKALLKQKLILPTDATGMRTEIDHVFTHQGLQATPFMEFDSYELVKQAVIAGLGVGILPADACRLEEHTGHLLRLNVEDFPLNKHWFFVYKDQKQLSELSMAFINFASQYSIQTHLKRLYNNA